MKLVLLRRLSALFDLLRGRVHDAIDGNRNLIAETQNRLDHLEMQAGAVERLQQQVDRIEQKISDVQQYGDSSVSENTDPVSNCSDAAGMTADAYKKHCAEVSGIYQGYTNSFGYYTQLVDELLAIDTVRSVPLYELLDAPAEGKALVGLRHDIDHDPETGLRCARYLAMQGVCGSFYLLHTSPYYGVFHGDTFVRNPLLADWIRGFIVAGCEIGLHNDALEICLNHDLDGVACVNEELNWLRSQGAVVSGTVAHNSGSKYGAENYEIFSDLLLWHRQCRNGLKSSLGSTSLAKMGLSYEGTFARPKSAIDSAAAAAFFADRDASDVRSPDWMRMFLVDNPCCEYTTDCQFWLVGKDMWIAAGHMQGSSLYEFGINSERMLELIDSLPSGSRSVVVVHPGYVRLA